MAHSCPECGQACYCNGDIDDIFINDEDAVNRCTHYIQRECDGYDGDDFDDENND